MTPSEKLTPAEFNSSTTWNDDLLKNPHLVKDKRKRVQQMFAAIAPSYDLNNRLHSLWMDQAWRRKAVRLANLKATDRVVDVACGTGDLTLAFVRALSWEVRWTGDAKKDFYPPPVIGIDFTLPMLPIARQKANRLFPETLLIVEATRGNELSSFINGDAQSLPLDGQSADVVSIAFGIRNVQDPTKALSEFRRVLRPGGRLIILEFSLPTNPILRSLYNFYFRQVLPRTATLISGDKTGAYKYLPESVNTFIGREQMMAMMRDAGFDQVEQFPMTFGVCVCYRGMVSG
jgi:demethylmenaquinone methyltransferase/2-methoxy-6-polyprenyl-1,4-benzoquinol methylase